MTNLLVRVNYVDAAVAYVTTPADYITLDLTNDYLIWSKTLADLMTHEPTPTELNAAAEIIDPSLAVTVAKCLLMDYSHGVGGGSIYTHLVIGMGLNKKFVYCFSFDGATATEPQLEAWDTSAHSTYVKNVLGLGTPANSMMKGVCTTTTLPGVGWAGAALAGASNVLLLNDGSGALSGAGDLYANLKIVIPAAYATPAAETFVLTVRYTYV
jgi:hypothetical protein